MKKDGGEVNMLTKIRAYRAQRKVRKWNRSLAQENNTALAMGKGVRYHHKNLNRIISGHAQHPKKKINGYDPTDEVLEHSLVLDSSRNGKFYQTDITQWGSVDPFYSKSSFLLVDGICRYLEKQYDQVISEALLVQELIVLFKEKNQQNVNADVIWKKIIEASDYSSIVLDVIKEPLLEEVFAFLNAQIVTQLAEGAIKKDETFSPRITVLFDSLSMKYH